MALSKDVVIRLLGDASSADKAIKAAADAADVSVAAYKRAEREMGKQAAAAERMAREQRAAMEVAGKSALMFGAVVAAGLAVSAKAAIDWESAWAGVTKTVTGTPAEMAALETELRKLAMTLPATHEEIAGVAEAAGQLGIKRQDVLEFTKVAIAMGVATNLSSDEAATGMARLSNIMGTSSKDVGRMGSSIVALGNNSATTEGEILSMALRLGAAGRQAGWSEGEVIGLSAAMSSLGIEAEAGGTAMSTVIKDINSAVLDGSEQLDRYAQVAGVSAAEFAKAWREDASGAMVTVVEGLARVQASGQNVNTVISDLGMDGIRTSDTLLRLAGNADGLADSMNLGNKAWAENNALVNEANQRYETTASKVKIAQNTLNDAAITVGDTLLPALASGADLVADFARGWSELPDELQTTVVVLGLAAAGIALVGGGAAVAAPKLLAFRTEMTLLAASSSTTASTVGKFGMFMSGPWGAAIGVATLALGGLVTWLGASAKASESAKGYQQQLAAALRESEGAIDDNVRALAAQKAADEMIGKSSLLEVADELGISLPKVTDALLGNRKAYDELIAGAEAYAQAALDAANGNTEDLGFQAALERSQAFKGALEDLAPSVGAAVAENERLAAAQAESGDAAEGSTPQLEGAAGAMGDMADSGEDAVDAAENLAKAIDALNGPTLNVREATRGYQSALDAATASIAEHGKNLDIDTEAGRENAEALDSVATAAMEQANAIYANTGSYDAFRSSLEDARGSLFDQATAFGMTDEEARKYVDTVLRIPDEATTGLELDGYDATRDQLNDVRSRVEGIPPEKKINVPALTEEATAKLRDLGYKVQTLPDGTVNIWADTAEAYTGLDTFLRTPAVKTVRIITDDSGATIGRDFSNGVKARASGGPVWPGEPFLVGEKGPELVHFDSPGTVIPADRTAQILATMRQPTSTASPGLGAGPSAYALPAAGPAGAVRLDIDYQRLAAALGGQRATVEVGQMIVPDKQHPYETAEALAFIGRTQRD
jgi:TP901 family phage tail tape measure protein